MGRRDDTTDGQQDTPNRSRLRVRGRDHHASSSDRSETAVSWIVVTLLSSAVLGMIGVLDKAFLYHYARTHLTLPLLIGIGHIPIGIVFIAISPLDDLTVGSAGWSLAAGVFGGLGGVIFFPGGGETGGLSAPSRSPRRFRSSSRRWPCSSWTRACGYSTGSPSW